MPAPTPRRLTAAMLAALLGAAPMAALAQTAAETTAAAETAPAVDLGAVVATVNGIEITLGEIILMRANLPDQYQSIPDAQLYEALVQQAVNQALLAEAGRAAGAAETPLARLRATVDARNFLAEAGLRGVIETATSEEALRTAYEVSVAATPPVEEVRASHILVADEAEAEALAAEARGGADFAALAAEHGTDGTKAQGGDLGWFAREQMVGPFAEAAFTAEEGVVTGPVQTQFGWHLILVTGKREKPAPSFEEMRQELARDAASEAAEAAISAAREGAEISLSDTPPDPSAIRRDDLLLPN